MSREVILAVSLLAAASPRAHPQLAEPPPAYQTDFPREEFRARWESIFVAIGTEAAALIQGAPMVLLTTKGARSGKSHITPLVPLIDADGLYVFASMGGAPKHPAWYHNVVANPSVTVEQGTESFAANAEILTGKERDDIYAKQAALLPAFGQYQARTTRTIPVVRLVRNR